MTHRIMLESGDRGGITALASGVSGMINAQPESLNRPSMVTTSPPTLPTTFIRLLCDMTSSRSGKTAYLGSVSAKSKWRQRLTPERRL